MGEDGGDSLFSTVRLPVRLRPFAALSVAATAAVLLAGCSGLGGGGATPSASGTDAPAVDLCDAQAPSGAASDAVTLDGDAGTPSTATFSSPVEITTLEVTTIDEGSGDPVADGDYVSYALTAYDAATGEKLGELGYQPGEVLPQPIAAANPLGQFLGCGAPGERVVAALPASGTEGDTDYVASAIYVVDLLERVPTAAWGAEQPAVDGLPIVTLAEDGTPSIEVPKTDPPAETQIATLKKGDGYTVASGDQVLIQFRGARWSSGELFDGGDTWASNSPYTGQTTGFVPGFSKALEGQTVGSQVLVVITPADGYGEGEINADDLTGDTLVFVIDILGAQKVVAQ